MHRRAATTLFLLIGVAVCLADSTVETSTTGSAVAITTLSRAAILLTVSVCMAATVLIVLIPTLAYHKFCGNNLRDEVV